MIYVIATVTRTNKQCRRRIRRQKREHFELCRDEFAHTMMCSDAHKRQTIPKINSVVESAQFSYPNKGENWQNKGLFELRILLIIFIRHNNIEQNHQNTHTHTHTHTHD